MQDRYVGDVGDFAKYALLRRLVGGPDERRIRLGVAWCLFPDETHNNDGRYVSYLDRPAFEGLDDRLLRTLRRIVGSGKRAVSSVSRSGIFPRETVFFAASVADSGTRHSQADRLRHRTDWLARCLTKTETCDLVFFDPDNGLEVASVPKRHPNAGKYIYWDEVDPFWRRGQALLIYHHLNRTASADQQVRRMQDRFRSMLGGGSAIPLVFRRGSCRIFWLACRENEVGQELKRRACEFLSSGWSRHFRPAGWPDEDQTDRRSAP
jgi:hypothetical protein